MSQCDGLGSNSEALADLYIKTALTLIEEAAHLIRHAGGNPAVELKPILDQVYQFADYSVLQTDSVEAVIGIS